MNFIALHSDELDMKELKECLEEIGDLYIAQTYEELIYKVEQSIDFANYYKALFIYPASDSKNCFDVIKKIRSMDKDFENRLQIIIFSNCEQGVHLLDKISPSSETFISSKFAKRRILELIERQN